MISLCMIVRDEAQNLKTCLSAVKSFVDEIIVVDTGSIDDTKNIALQFTNRVYDFKWCDDFSKARNFSLSKASNEWVLVLDADEYVLEFNSSAINSFIEDANNQDKAGRIKRINIIEDGKETKKYIERVNRLFNKKFFCYEGIIHEQVASVNRTAYNTEFVDITVDHCGYTKEAVGRTDKLKRNIELLNSAVSVNEDDPYLLYQLGKSYYMLKDYSTAASYFERALYYVSDFKLEYVEDLIETYGYTLINGGRYLEAIGIERYRVYYSNYADYLFLMGHVYMNNCRFSDAIDSFLKAANCSCGKIEGVNSYLAFYNIGVIFECLGYKENAIEFYSKCGGYIRAVERLNSIFHDNLNS